MAYELRPLFSPQSIEGFMSAQDGKGLPPGYASLLQNVRLGDGITRARWGDASISTGLSSGFRGAYEATVDGIRTLYRAYASGGKVSLDKSLNDGVTWSTLTASSGPYGDTRLTDNGLPIRFCIARDRSFGTLNEYDLLLVQNGVDSPRIYGQNTALSSAYGSGVFGMSVVAQPPTISDGDCSLVFGAVNTAGVNGGSLVIDNTNGGGHLSFTRMGPANGSYYYELSVGTATVPTDVVTLAVAAQPLSATIKQVFLLGYSSDLNGFWQNVKVEVSDTVGGTYQTLYDPSLPGASAFLPITTIAPHDTENWQQIALPLTGITLASIRVFRFSWPGAAPGSVTKGELVAIAYGGSVPGSTRYGISYFGSDQRSIGPGVIPTTVATSIPARLDGGKQFGYVTLIESPLFFWQYIVNFPNPANYAAGIDYALFYRQQPGEIDYYYFAKLRLAHYSGSWSLDGANPLLVDAGAETEDLSQTLPSGATVVLPVGTAMAAANGRLFVGSGARLWFSVADLPFRFTKAVQFLDATNADPLSGGSLSFDGQTVQTIVPSGAFSSAAEDLSSPISGAATLHILTDRNLFALSGFTSFSLSRPMPICPYGTLSPLSVARSRQGFYWLDDRGQVAFYSMAGVHRLSVSEVDDKTSRIPASRKAWAVGMCANDRFYLGYTPNGGTANTNALVWYERTQKWESDDTFSPSAESLLGYYSAGYVKIVRFSDTSVYEHEQPFSVNPVALNVVTGTIHDGGISRFDVASVQVWLDQGTYTLTCRRLIDGTNYDGALNVTGAGQAVLMDPAGTGGGGISVIPSIFGTVPGGTAFYSAFIQAQRATNPASRA